MSYALKRKPLIIMTQKRNIRILIAKSGLDGHDRGARIIAKTFSNAGFEVIYSGLHQSPEDIVQSAIQEDVDMIGISSLAGAHMHNFIKVMELLKEQDADDIVVCGGGIFPDDDIPILKDAGVKEIFTPGTQLPDVVEWVDRNVIPRE